MLEIQDLKDFSISTWYEQFKNVTIKSIVIVLEPELLEKLRTDGSINAIDEICTENYVNQIKNAIILFQNEAFVKNNWHAPTDAKFMSFDHTLKVTNVSDLFLYFTASDIVMNDLGNEKFEPFCICLRPWIDIHPANEFRCIVVNNILRGITPRDWPTFYSHYAEEGLSIIEIISAFFTNHIQHKFLRKTYIFDVFITYPDTINLLDFGPLNSKTNLYAFRWNEVHSIIKKNCQQDVAPVFRYLEKDIGIRARSDLTISSIQQC